MKFERLFQPIEINGMTLKNRIVMTAIHLGYSEDGTANDRINSFYWRRAEGGAAMLIIGGVASDNYIGYPNMLRMDDDKYIPGYKVLTDGIHERGAKICMQLMQTGRYGLAMFVEGDDSTISASSVPSRQSPDVSRTMTVEEIKTVIRKAGEAAARAKRAGFDAVELTAASGYMISQFLSPLTNLREDEYGGSEENRMRFGLEMVSAVRSAVGADFPVIVRVAGNEFMEGGNGSDFSVAFSKKLEEAGADMLDVTGGWHETNIPQLPGDVPVGGYVYLAQAIKNAVSIPVLSANRHNDPLEAEMVLALGQADMIGQCRTQIADPDWVRKTQSGEIDSIRRCVACNQGCLAKVFFAEPCQCLINSEVGREYLAKDAAPAAAGKRLLVVGGGPAGCEFSYRAAQAGHEVTLWEKESFIGGKLPLVAAPPAKKDFAGLLLFLDAMLKRTGVKLELNKTANEQDIKNGGFDAVIFATGAKPKTLTLPGSGRPAVYTAEDILAQRVIAGRDVVVIGGGSVGCETADYLASEGSLSKDKLHFLVTQAAELPETVYAMANESSRKISIIDVARIGANFDNGCGWPVFKDLSRLGVKKYPMTQIVEVTDDKIIVDALDRKTKEIMRVEIPCDTIVTAVGYDPDNELYKEIKKSGITAYNIGDSETAGKIIDAISSAAGLAAEI